ncbi:MAG: hypothetical protein VKL39_09360 [Leptolyngbyaceae bacterium]|nr:hypothetical protein [Leptolyngbyaceae bacterium]
MSCSEGKISQCNRLIEIANQAASSVESVTSSATPDDPDAFLRIADAAETATANLEALDVDDETLQNYREQFISLYVETSAATRQLVEAVKNQDAEAADEAYNQLESATEREIPLVEDVNAYCSGSV